MDYDQFERLMEALDIIKNLNFINIKCVSHYDLWQKCKWPPYLQTRPMIGDRIRSTSHNDIEAVIVKITHCTDYLELEVRTYDGIVPKEVY
jgi:hypothetical protein